MKVTSSLIFRCERYEGKNKVLYLLLIVKSKSYRKGAIFKVRDSVRERVREWFSVDLKAHSGHCRLMPSWRT